MGICNFRFTANLIFKFVYLLLVSLLKITHIGLHGLLALYQIAILGPLHMERPIYTKLDIYTCIATKSVITKIFYIGSQDLVPTI